MQAEIKRNRHLITHIKDKHSAILEIESKIAFAADLIRKKKAEGLQPEDSKKREVNKHKLLQN